MDEEFKSEWKNLLKDVASIKSTTTETKEIVESLTTRVEQLEEDREEIKDQVGMLWEENYMLRQKIESMEQYSRVNNVIIHGIPAQSEENLRNVICELAKHLEVDVSDNDICTTHRLPSKDSIPPIIVKFNNRDKKNKLITNSKIKKLNGEKIGLSTKIPIFVGAHLSKHSAQLLHVAKDLVKNNRIAFAWTNAKGEVLIREEEGGRAKIIYSHEQLADYDQEANRVVEDSQRQAKEARGTTEVVTREEDRNGAGEKKNNNNRRKNQKQQWDRLFDSTMCNSSTRILRSKNHTPSTAKKNATNLPSRGSGNSAENNSNKTHS